MFRRSVRRLSIAHASKSDVWEHAVGIDFVDRVTGLERVAVELTLDSARSLVAALQTALAKADEFESA